MNTRQSNARCAVFVPPGPDATVCPREPTKHPSAQPGGPPSPGDLSAKQICLTQGKIALVDDCDFKFLNHWKWYAHRDNRSWYAVRARRKSEPAGPCHILMHRVLLCPPSGLETDHINGNGLDNRRINLRAVTRGVNHANTIHGPANRIHDSPMGVCPHKSGFMAQIQIRGQNHYLGMFKTSDEAHAAYMVARHLRIRNEISAATAEAANAKGKP